MTLLLLLLLSTDGNVSWEDLQAELGKHVCAVRETTGGYRAYLGEPERCGSTAPASDVEQAVDDAVREATRVLPDLWDPVTGRDLVPLTPRPTDPELLPDVDLDTVVLSQPEVLWTLIPRLEAALHARGLRCVGCPEPPPVESEILDWEEFAPYVSAYVRTQPEAPGRWPVKICGGPRVDPGWDLSSATVRRRLRAAYAVVQESPSLWHWAIELSEEPEFPAEDFAREAVFDERAQHDDAIRDLACDVLLRFRSDFGIRLRDCPDQTRRRE